MTNKRIFVSDGGYLRFLHIFGQYDDLYSFNQLNNGFIGLVMSENILKEPSFMFLRQLFTKL